MGCDAVQSCKSLPFISAPQEEAHGIQKLGFVDSKFLGKLLLTWHYISEHATIKTKISSEVLKIKSA
jgi:hypothetical protein